MCKDAVTGCFNKAVSKCEKLPMPKMSKTPECFERLQYTLRLSLLLFSCSVMSNSLRPTLWPAAYQASLSFTISQSLLKFMPIESVMPSNLLIFCCPFLLLSSIFLSIGVFSNELALLIRWPKYWSFSLSIRSSNEYSALISFRIDWFDLAVRGTFKSLLQHHS